ncbi:hypothetical protein HYH03_012828 [Edaphochlamys debaryana]|uniref:Uncharacterized protein n=1 Tax=Edaphochlamys debaryana TaxID=47281 RepID=A0A836BU26_9CHLO|nr:hypothetical protein HYH03_012828 [Edaphochlamys debaryana]|eukprot:KAG2488667.1 hypothetical protein HYH03_012828 [Edaphochlamys debaryana]
MSGLDLAYVRIDDMREAELRDLLGKLNKLVEAVDYQIDNWCTFDPTDDIGIMGNDIAELRLHQHRNDLISQISRVTARLQALEQQRREQEQRRQAEEQRRRQQAEEEQRRQRQQAETHRRQQQPPPVGARVFILARGDDPYKICRRAFGNGMLYLNMEYYGPLTNGGRSNGRLTEETARHLPDGARLVYP